MVTKLSVADQILGRLGGEARRLPNPHLFIRPFIKREAVFSSRIEGTQATLGDLLAAEAGAHVERSPDDLREVGNYGEIYDRYLGPSRSVPTARSINALWRDGGLIDTPVWR